MKSRPSSAGRAPFTFAERTELRLSHAASPSSELVTFSDLLSTSVYLSPYPAGVVNSPRSSVYLGHRLTARYADGTALGSRSAAARHVTWQVAAGALVDLGRGRRAA